LVLLQSEPEHRFLAIFCKPAEMLDLPQ